MTSPSLYKVPPDGLTTTPARRGYHLNDRQIGWTRDYVVLTDDYYNPAFHFCQPEGVPKAQPERLGSILFGGRIFNSPFDVSSLLLSAVNFVDVRFVDGYKDQNARRRRCLQEVMHRNRYSPGRRQVHQRENSRGLCAQLACRWTPRSREKSG